MKIRLICLSDSLVDKSGPVLGVVDDEDRKAGAIPLLPVVYMFDDFFITKDTYRILTLLLLKDDTFSQDRLTFVPQQNYQIIFTQFFRAGNCQNGLDLIRGALD